MPDIHVQLELGKWLVVLLRTALDMNVHLDRIPLKAPLPAVRFTTLSPHDVRVVSQEIIMTTSEVLIVVVFEGEDLSALAAHAADLHAALHKVTGTTDVLRVMAVTRLEPYVQTFVEEGRLFTHAGGIYRVQVQPL